MASTRVIPPYQSRGLYALTAAIGLLLGPVMGLLVLHSRLNLTSFGVTGEIATVFLIPLLFVLFFAARCQRRRPVFLTALTFGFSYWLSFITAQDLSQQQSGGARIASGFWPAFLIASLLLGLIAALAALAVRWTVRSVLVVHVEQTGGLCAKCAYPLDHSRPLDDTAPSPCPECGSLPAPSRTRGPIAAFALRAGRSLFALTLLLFISLAAATFVRRGYPIYRFQSALAVGGPQPAGFMEHTAPGGGLVQTFTAGAWIPFPGSPSRGVIAAYLPVDEPGFPAMQLWVADKSPPSSYFTATPAVFCSLSRPQADHVIQHGVPPSLLTALEAAARPGPAPGAPDRTEIDPAPYFPR